MADKRKFIGQYLLDKGIITKAQLDEAVEEWKRTGRKIGEIFVKHKYATEEEIAGALSEQLGFSFLDLSSYQIETSVISLMPSESAARLQAIPLFKVGNSLTVAMANPLDVGAIDEISRLAGGLRITPVVGTATGIKDAIKKYYYETPLPAQAAPPAAAQPSTAPKSAPEALMKEAVQAPVIKLVDKLIEEAVKSDASDIHLEPQEKDFYCRLRIDGVLHDTEPPPKKLQRAVISRLKIMANMDIAQTRLPQDGRIELKVLARNVDLRVATFPTIYGEHVSLRILDKTQGIIDIEKLGFQADDLKKLKDIIYKPYGFILVTGPTGSGKTTTLYAVLNKINDLKKNIITLEDPVEYTITRIHQSQVNVKAGFTFATGLRSIVRLDPDIIMIGEIRDKETADIAIHSSLTGHLVFSTLHTNDAPSCATRLIDIGVEPYMVTSALLGVVAQRLVRKLCNKCKKKYKPTPEELQAFSYRPEVVKSSSIFYKPDGCKECGNTGFKGRTGIYEVLIPDSEIKELIVKKMPAHELKKAAQKKGMRTLHEDGLMKVAQGITSLSEILRVTEEV